MSATQTLDLVWDSPNANGTSLVEWLDHPTLGRNEVIRRLEAASGLTGDWEFDSYGANWWGISGTYKGEVFTLYTHKGSDVHIGGDSFKGALDVKGLVAALLALVDGTPA